MCMTHRSGERAMTIHADFEHTRQMREGGALERDWEGLSGRRPHVHKAMPNTLVHE